MPKNAKNIFFKNRQNMCPIVPDNFYSIVYQLYNILKTGTMKNKCALSIKVRRIVIYLHRLSK